MTDLNKMMKALKAKGTERTRKIYASHGMAGNSFGVSAADLKVFAKSIKGQHELALELYDTGKVEVDMRGTSCKVPVASDYIAKIEKAGRAGKKRSALRC
ncbi:MAG: 3-methyladenine DNA glycosylase AlkD [Planctomycetota bacterium]|jgi:hypothetical protein